MPQNVAPTNFQTHMTDPKASGKASQGGSAASDHTASLLALCGDGKDKVNFEIKKVLLSLNAQESVIEIFLKQEQDFRKNREEVPYDESWMNDNTEIFTIPIPQESAFNKIFQATYRTFNSLDSKNDLNQIRGLAIKINDSSKQRILVQLFEKYQSLEKDNIFLSWISSSQRYERLQASTFCLHSKLLCIIEDNQIKFHKFHKFHNLSRLIDTSSIFKEATREDVKQFMENHSNLFEFDESFMENIN